jgi:hypothetical protein
VKADFTHVSHHALARSDAANSKDHAFGQNDKAFRDASAGRRARPAASRGLGFVAAAAKARLAAGWGGHRLRV